MTGLLTVGSAASAQADGTRDKQWMIDFLNLDEAWKITKGKGVTVGIVDTGIDSGHPDIKNNIEGGKSFSGETKDGLEDTGNHGTGIASLIAGHGTGGGDEDGIIGVAPEAKILSAQIEGDTDDFQEQEAADAVRWLADNGADVIAMGNGHPIDVDVEHEAIKYAAIERGIPIVAGIGNVGEQLGPNGAEISRTATTYPAGYEEVIGVSGVNKGGKLDGVSMYGSEVAVAAPGSRDVTAAKSGGGAENFGGTSAAQAITAGVLALLKANYPDETRMELTWRLTELAAEAGEEGPDDKYGFGIVNPVKALTEDPGPLPEDLKDPEPTGTYPDDKASAPDDAAANDSDGITTTALIVAVAALIAVAAVVTLIILIRRMKRRRLSHTSSNLPPIAHSLPPNPPQQTPRD